jgi:hypothetical protein
MEFVRSVVPHRFELATAEGRLSMPIHTSHALESRDSQIERAIIALHGRRRNAEGMWQNVNAARLARSDAPRIAVIAPQFLNSADVQGHRLADSVLRWDSGRWVQARSAVGRSTGSFSVLDAILGRLPASFRRLREVVVAGHSGGGQAAQRYAAVSGAEEALKVQGVAVRYVVANPSSYVYFNDVPWKHGLRDAPAYVRRSGLDALQLEQRYAARNVTYLLGAADNDPMHPDLERSPEASAQGEHRLSRGINYYRYIHERQPTTKHQLSIVPGVGHNNGQMFGSPQGKATLF